MAVPIAPPDLQKGSESIEHAVRLLEVAEIAVVAGALVLLIRPLAGLRRIGVASAIGNSILGVGLVYVGAVAANGRFMLLGLAQAVIGFVLLRKYVLRRRARTAPPA